MSSQQQQQQLNKPANTLFKQQRLPAWQPILSPPHVTGCFFLVACIFIPIGAAILAANNRVVDVEIPYSQVRKCTYSDNEAVFTYNVDGVITSMGCNVPIQFEVPKKMEAPVYLYYRLTNFYQNHRRFAKSRNDKQIAGEETAAKDMSDCEPLLHPGDTMGSGGTPISVNGQDMTYSSLAYSPAGLIAWSMFNDSFSLYKVTATTPVVAKTLICNGSDFSRLDSEPLENPAPLCAKKGIAWDSDREAKFQAPHLSSTVWSAQRSVFVANNLSNVNASLDPVHFPATSDTFFRMGWYANESGHEVPAATDEDLMVWMRTASLPTFRKLYRVINVDLEPGLYEMEIVEQYDVSSFEGEKSFVLSTVSWVGGRNDFLGIAYIVVGVCAVIAGIVFITIHRVFGDRSQKAVEELMNELR